MSNQCRNHGKHVLKCIAHVPKVKSKKIHNVG